MEGGMGAKWRGAKGWNGIEPKTNQITVILSVKKQKNKLTVDVEVSDLVCVKMCDSRIRVKMRRVKSDI